MASLASRRGRFYIDFRFKGIRYREQTEIVDNPVNHKKVKLLVKKMEAEITLGTFDYLTYFPEGKSSSKFKTQKDRLQFPKRTPQSFETFLEIWFSEKKVEWRQSYIDVTRCNIDKHILPFFTGKYLDEVDKALILKFRSHLANLQGPTGKSLSASSINHIMIPLRMILIEGSDRFKYQNPWVNIKRIREKKPEIIPFAVAEVQKILNTVRKDYKSYYTTRFFTGMRSSEIDGLLWKYVDFDRKQILVREALVQDKMVSTKNDGSSRDIDMNTMVYETLLAHKQEVGGRSPYVFSTQSGAHLHNRNVTQRIWYPLLRYLGLDKRRPYQTRHTAATMWLGSGENPEWIVRQMGHTTTKMLFTVYSRFVPNLTRRDGSAFEKLLAQNFTNTQKEELS